MCYLDNYTFLSHQVYTYVLLIIYHKTACPHSHVILRSKTGFLPFKIQKSIHNHQIYDVNGIKKTKC